MEVIIIKRIINGIISLLFAIIGFIFAYSFIIPQFSLAQGGLRLAIIIAAPLIVGAAGFLLAPFIARRVTRLTDSFVVAIASLSVKDLLCAVAGLIAGLIVAALLNTALGRIALAGAYLSLVSSVFLGYLGLVIGYKRRNDLMRSIRTWRAERSDSISDSLETSPRSLRGDKGDKGERRRAADLQIAPKVLDTSVIIDGRVADIYRIGFIEGVLIIPAFVLEELQHIADSPDALKRVRGRRGLDILNTLRDDFGDCVMISEKDYSDLNEVDSKLLRLAKELKGAVLTNDYNLNKVAQFHGVRVLNINELSNAVKAVVLPGEEMTAQIVKEGKEHGQGVAYLDDGTMIVVEGGRRYIGKLIYVLVTSVLQTAAGRMIFARPKLNKQGEAEYPESDNAEAQVV